MKMFDPKEITAEKDLWSIYKLSRRLPKNKFNNYCLLIILTIFIIYAINTKEETYVLLERLNSWAMLGVEFSSAILGFLIAGFTIFATMSNINMLRYMARTRYDKENGISWLKYYFTNFVDIFIYYIYFLIISLFVIMSMHKHSLIIIKIHEYVSSERPFILLMLIIIGVSFFYIILQLKSFIFNVYHFVMTSIRFSEEMNEVENKDEK